MTQGCVWILPLLLLLAAPAIAQPRAIEIFGQVGALRFGDDEGSPGTAPSWGGAIALPLTKRYAIDMDVQTAKVSVELLSPFRFTEQRALISPALVVRWGTDRAYGFIGGGVGAQIDQTRSTNPIFAGTPPVQTGVVEVKSRNSGMTLHSKAGLVISPNGRLLIRVDLAVAFRYVLPSIGIRAGVGYRF